MTFDNSASRGLAGFARDRGCRFPHRNGRADRVPGRVERFSELLGVGFFGQDGDDGGGVNEHGWAWIRRDRRGMPWLRVAHPLLGWIPACVTRRCAPTAEWRVYACAVRWRPRHGRLRSAQFCRPRQFAGQPLGLAIADMEGHGIAPKAERVYDGSMGEVKGQGSNRKRRSTRNHKSVLRPILSRRPAARASLRSL